MTQELKNNNKEKNLLAVCGNRFFGKMSASATHEIKNTLSIINENAGLLEDLSLMAQNGQPLSPEKITQISSSLKRQVDRTDIILKNLNQFSHSVDKDTQSIDLEETTRFILTLSSRLTQMKGVSFKVIPSQGTLKVVSSLFNIQNIIWYAIDTSCALVSGDKCVTVSFEITRKAKKINFSFDIADKNMINNLFNSKEEKALIAHLGICIEQNNKNTFGLIWPERI